MVEIADRGPDDWPLRYVTWERLSAGASRGVCSYVYLPPRALTGARSAVRIVSDPQLDLLGRWGIQWERSTIVVFQQTAADRVSRVRADLEERLRGRSVGLVSIADAEAVCSAPGDLVAQLVRSKVLLMTGNSVYDPSEPAHASLLERLADTQGTPDGQLLTS